MFGLEPFARAGALIALLIAGSVIMQPGFGQTLGKAAGSHWVLIAFIALLWLAWRPIKFAARFFFEGLFLGWGVRESGLFRQRRARRPSGLRRWWL